MVGVIAAFGVFVGLFVYMFVGCVIVCLFLLYFAFLLGGACRFVCVSVHVFVCVLA